MADAFKSIPENFHLINPPMRDSFATAQLMNSSANAWIAVRYFVGNPGAFLLHCHIDTPLQGGMALAIQDGIDAWPIVPPDCLN